MRLALILWTLLFAVTLSAQVPQESILLPVIVETPVPGAHGSLWTTEVALTYTGDSLVFVYGVETGCPLPTCPAENVVGAGTTLYPLPLGLDKSVNAHLLIVTDDPDGVSVQITAQDQSRRLGTWGTSIPAVRESDAFRRPFQLIDVPGDRSRFRSLLRIYSFTPMQSARARVRIFRTRPDHRVPYEPNEPDLLVAERVEDLRVSDGPFTPGYVQIPLWTINEIADDARLRIEVVPETPGIAFWAMVSVTNNDTQHITIIAPQ